VVNWLPMIANTVIGLLLVPFMIRYLGKADYGVWMLVNSVVGYYGLLRMGVDTSIMRFLPFYAGRQNQQAAAEVVSTALGMFSLVGVAILLLSLVAAGPISRFYGGGHQLALLIVLTGLAGALECPYRVVDATLRAKEKWGSANLVAVIMAVLRAGAIVACVWLGYRLIGMGCATIVVTLATLTLAVTVFRKVSSNTRLGFSMFSWSRLPEMLSFGALTAMTTLVYGLLFQEHRLIIGKLVSFEAVAIYTIPATLVDRLRQAAWMPVQVSWPRFALLHGEQSHHELSRLYERGSRYCGQLSAFLVLLMLLFGPPFIRLWVGDGFEKAEPLLIILCVGVLVESSSYMNGSFLGGTGRQRAQALFALTEGILGLALSLYLGWRHGMAGVAWGYTISVSLVRGVASTVYVCGLLHISAVRRFYHSFFIPWLFAGTIACAGYALRMPARINDWYSLIAISTLCIAGAVGGMYTFVMNEEERARIVGWTRRLLPSSF
jgi:O-antigen/teichoic acid export membrane protein